MSQGTMVESFPDELHASRGRPAMQAVGEGRCIALFGQFGIGNLGNDATLWVALDHLRRECPATTVLCICPRLPDFAAAYPVEHLPLDPLPPRGQWRVPRILRTAYVALATLLSEPFRRRRARRLLGTVERLVIVGTGAFDDFGERPWTMPAAILRWCRVGASSSGGVDALAVGVGPIADPINRWLMHRALGIAVQRSYRDVVSRQYAERHHIHRSNDMLVPDLVFAHPPEWIAGLPPPSSPPRRIGLGVMGYFGWKNQQTEGDATYRGYIGQMATWVMRLIDRGYGVDLLIGQIDTDDQAVADLLSELDHRFPDRDRARLRVPEIGGVPQLLDAIGRVDVVISPRYHNIVCALALSRPVIALGYAAKFRSLLSEFGLDEHCQHIDGIDLDVLAKQFDDVVARHAGLVAAIARRSAELRTRVESQLERSLGSPASTRSTVHVANAAR